MTASPVCRHHNVWFSESLVSASRSIPPPPPPPLLRDRARRLAAVGADGRLLSGDEVVALLGELDARLVDAGGDVSIDVSIGDGAAMALLMDNRATVDVDVLNREMPEALASAAADIADAKGLPADWINSSASAYADMGDPGFSAEPVFRGSLLTVRRPDLEHLLAHEARCCQRQGFAGRCMAGPTVGHHGPQPPLPGGRRHLRSLSPHGRERRMEQGLHRACARRGRDAKEPRGAACPRGRCGGSRQRRRSALAFCAAACWAESPGMVGRKSRHAPPLAANRQEATTCPLLQHQHGGRAERGCRVPKASAYCLRDIRAGTGPRSDRPGGRSSGWEPPAEELAPSTSSLPAVPGEESWRPRPH